MSWGVSKILEHQDTNHTKKFNKLDLTKTLGTSLAVQWLRSCTPNARSLGLIPGQGTRSHLLQQKTEDPWCHN